MDNRFPTRNHSDSGLEPSILIISGARGDTRRYRTFHLYEQTRLLGLNSMLSHVTDRHLVEKVAASDIIVLHRAAYNPQIAWLEREIHAKNGLLIHDLDDLIFDPQAFQYINSVDFADPVRASLYKEEMSLNRKTLEISDVALTSTIYLSECLVDFGKPVRVHRNAFSQEMLQRSEKASREHQPAKDRLIIGYASGTSTHNQDFALIKPALQAILSRHINVELWLVGPLDPGDGWNGLQQQVRRIKFVPWQNLPEIQVQFDLNLAPLQIDNPFGQSKSEIKYVEAALLRVPTIASPSGAFTYAIRQGDNGFLAKDSQEWEQTLERLITQPILRHTVGERAFEDVQQRYHPWVRARELAETLETLLNQKLAADYDLNTSNQRSKGTLPSYWDSVTLERTPTLFQRGLYTLRYRNLRTLIKQLWIYFRRLVVPIFPYRVTPE
jgi:glycosyltransferase involved in cell wall biosynthesis